MKNMEYKVKWYNDSFEFPDNWNTLDYIGGNGPEVEALQEELTPYTGTRWNLAVNNGTSALLVAMMAIKHQREQASTTPIKWVVGVPNFTFIATFNAAATVFGHENIVLLDADPMTWNVSPEIAKEAIDMHGMNLLVTVDVGGAPCDYENLRRLKIPIIADSAESLGSKYAGNPIGQQADIHTFSLHRAKVVSSGEGGIVSTNKLSLYNLMKAMINHGYHSESKPWEYRHSVPALNFRMTNVHGALARKSLSKISEKIAKRVEIADIYGSVLDSPRGFPINIQRIPAWADTNYFFYGVRVPEDYRYKIVQQLLSHGIEVKTWSAVSDASFIDIEPCSFGTRMFAEELAASIILLPIHDGMTERQAYYVALTFNAIVNQYLIESDYESNQAFPIPNN